ncbi:hypothetical protein [Luteimonas sp. 9C]|uniref:hypothetical protein n=1 Tax=Luteimonas sp. 9C TaxID=2653148 RepID=UPI00135C351E|nr:hypothetical protein [Luteimonas sp. 9C]
MALLVVWLAACAGGLKAEQHPQRSVSWILQQYERGDPAALERVLDMLGTTASYTPHDIGPSRDLEDARIYNIGGFGSGDMWFRLQASPCYSLEQARRVLKSGLAPRSERSYRYENSRYVLFLRMSTEHPDCLHQIDFLPVALAK